MTITQVTLSLAAFYCAVMWLFLVARSIATHEDYEIETFHLGLCGILALGFLGLLLK